MLLLVFALRLRTSVCCGAAARRGRCSRQRSRTTQSDAFRRNVSKIASGSDGHKAGKQAHDTQGITQQMRSAADISFTVLLCQINISAKTRDAVA